MIWPQTIKIDANGGVPLPRGVNPLVAGSWISTIEGLGIREFAITDTKGQL